MISRVRKELQNRKKDNKGAALVTVIIAIAFIGMLVAMVLYMAYCNYLMKNNDRVAKDNFYSAEYALDVINAGLQVDISKAMSDAYVDTMKDSSGKLEEEMEDTFQEKFRENLQELIEDPTDSSKWNMAHLVKFWQDNNMTIASSAGMEGAYLGTKKDESNNELNNLEALMEKDYLTMYNLEIVYTDKRGFVSIINTDLRIKVPEIGFAQSATKMSIEQFSLIANDSLVNDNNYSPEEGGLESVTLGSNVRISGNVFGGYDGVQIGNQKRTEFAVNEDDKLTGGTYSYNLITDSLNVYNALDDATGLYVDETFVTYVNDINVQTARLDMAGKMFVGDDLDIAGTGSEVKLSGNYRGYGNALGRSDGSSSILVNGGSTSLDFRGLDELVLSGHAYVGAKKYDADRDRLAYVKGVSPTTGEGTPTDPLASDKIEDEEEYKEKLQETDDDGNLKYEDKEGAVPQNENDILMGESISIKANQLLYMVPAECVGYHKATGTQVIAKNPMTYDEYNMLLTEEEVEDEDGNKTMERVYDPVRLDKLWEKLGGVSYTSDYKAVYRRVNGTVLVYLYLDFGSSELMANEFFKAYYEYDKTGIDNYVNSYIRDMKWSDELSKNNGAMLTLAGNAFTLNANKEVQFVDDDLQDGDKFLNMLSWQTEYSNIHESMMHSLSPDIDKMTSTQQSSEIFDSLVDASKLATMGGLYKTTNDIHAVIRDGNVIYPDASACPDTTRLIVASGDIYLKANFSGLAIAGGNIYVGSSCSQIDYNPTAVLQAMRATPDDGTGDEEESEDEEDKVYVYQVFGVNGSLSYGGSGEKVEEEKVELSDLILYQNWKKE